MIAWKSFARMVYTIKILHIVINVQKYLYDHIQIFFPSRLLKIHITIWMLLLFSPLSFPWLMLGTSANIWQSHVWGANIFLGKTENKTGSVRHSPSVMWVLKISRIMIILQQGRNNGPSGGREGRSQSIFCDWVLMTIIRQSMSLQWMPDLLPTWWPPEVSAKITFRNKSQMSFVFLQQYIILLVNSLNPKSPCCIRHWARPE